MTRLFDKHEVAERLKLSEFQVRRLAHAHRIGINVGGSVGYRFTEDDIAALVDALRTQREAS